MNAETDLSRRKFLQTTAAVGAGLVIGISLPLHKILAAQAPVALPAPSAFLRIASDGRITVLLAHSEMGQGIWTALPMLIAEELDADWQQIRVEHAPAAPAYAHTAWGIQGTGGSTSTWSEFDRYRQAGAMAKALLISAAAQKAGVAETACKADNGFVLCGNKRFSYGELADAAAKLPTPTSVKLKDAKDWQRIGKPTKRLDTPEKITGKAVFGIDVQFPGLLTAVVARSPVFGGKVKSVDASAAKAVKGVRNVVQVPSGVAVIADHYWAAKQGRDALKIEWERGPVGTLDSDELKKQYQALAKTPGAMAAKSGDVDSALAKAKKVLEMEYHVPYLAHAPMEPLNCTVKIDKDSCEIWTGTQFQTLDQGAAAKILNLKPEQVQIHTTFLGGGFGRRANPASDFVIEAVQIAKAANAPVKTVWSREDDTHGGYYRPMYVQRVRVALDNSGLPQLWDHQLVGQSILTGTPFEQYGVKDGVDHSSVEGVADSPYLKHVANVRVGLHSPKPGVPVLWWRSVGHSYNSFVMESVIDELAKQAGKDPLAYRRAVLKDQPRHLGVLNLAAEKAGWGKQLPKGRARGIAVHESFGSFVAQVAEVSVENGTIRVHKVTCAIDCGIAVNPDGIRAQIESGVAYGLSAALHGKLTFKNGEVQQSNFHDYPVLRLNEMPQVETHIVNSSEKPGGVGEPGTPPIAPAVANAVAALTGKRLRELPLVLPA